MKENLTIKRRLFFTITAILALSYAFLFFFSVKSLQSVTADELAKDLDSALRFTKSQFVARPETVLEALKLQASSEAMQEMFANNDQVALEKAVHSWTDAFEFIELLSLVDARQHAIARINGRRQVNTFLRGPLLDDLFKRRQAFTTTELVPLWQYCDEVRADVCNVVSDNSEVMVQLVFVPVLSHDGRVLGAIVAGDDVNKDMHLPFQQQKVFGKNIELLITQKAALIASTMAGNDIRSAKLSPEAMKSLLDGYQFSGSTRLNGQSYEMLAESLQNHKGEFIGAIAVALPQSYFLGIRHENIQFLLLCGAVSMLLIIAFAYFTSWQYTRPLQRFAEAVNAIEHGDLSLRLPEDERFEFKSLAAKFNNMAEALSERDATIVRQNLELTRLNQDLEAKVAERTVRLEAETGMQRAVITSLLDGMIVADNTQVIMEFNPAAELLLGMKAAIMIGMPLRSLCEYPGLEELEELLPAGGVTKKSPQDATVVLLQYGEKNLRFLMTGIVDELGCNRGFLLGIRDETAYGELDRLKGGFIAKVSHELKTPLTSMKGSLQFILNKGKWLTGVERDMLEVCLRNTERLINIVGNILELSRIESGQIAFSMRFLQLGEVVLYALEEIKAKALARTVSLVNEVPMDLPLVYGDYERLSQVIAHLLANAVKFSPSDTVVTISAAVEGGFLIISVSDSAKVIPEKYRQELFSKFQQFGNPEEGEYCGSGLGLAICREIVAKHGGDIWHAPGIVAGNVFTFRLPMIRGAEQ